MSNLMTPKRQIVMVAENAEVRRVPASKEIIQIGKAMLVFWLILTAAVCSTVTGVITAQVVAANAAPDLDYAVRDQKNRDETKNIPETGTVVHTPIDLNRL